ncbi:rRNA methyltransferase 3, mitochondrial [Nomia melanderi]|uniref:rRNA methyltransferase 3, mitochondrial n=1 Tax=Nomia melanderi TaxID=2448451 RepID=UPI0013046C92|nr:rRNA methyltransferase 3, mitochondrial [Nomia melanderi]
MALFNVTCTMFRLHRHASMQFQSIKTTVNVLLNPTRTYVRWMNRRPVAIVNEEELYDTEDTTKEKFIEKREAPSKKPIRKEQSKKATDTSASEKKKPFTVFEHNDKTITSLMTKVKSRKRREKNDMIILEGHRLINDAVKAGAELDILLFNNKDDLNLLNLPSNAQLYKVPYKTIQLWSSLFHSPGLIGIFKTPDVSNNAPAENALPLTVICDNIRDPGNLGSIMRAVAAVGCEKLILIKGCIDLWDPKVLRAASGAHFRVPIHAFPTWADISPLLSEDSNVFVTDSNFRDEFLSHYNTETLEPSMGIFNVDPELLKLKTIDSNNENETVKSKLRTPLNKKTMAEFLLKLPIVPYYTIDYTRKEIVLVLTGETEGLTVDSYKFLNERNGIRINIPLANGVDSLNTGVALGIVTFEIKRQFIKRQNEL